jgi:hypothetical protein
VVVEIGGDEKAPIILGRPFLRTAKAIIYTDDAKICFTIKGERREIHCLEQNTAISCSSTKGVHIQDSRKEDK